MPTYFHSTRSKSSRLTSKQAIRRGLADNGGLFITDDLGSQQFDLRALQGKSYQQIAMNVLGVLLPDYSDDELRECIRAAYGRQWDDSAITPLKPLNSGNDCSDFVLELFHGPTSAFKDVALQMLPQLMKRTREDTSDEAAAGLGLEHSGRSECASIMNNAPAISNNSNTTSGSDERIMILTATSGDTGKAALEGFADTSGTGITVFYPEGKVSEVQRRQMTTQRGGNVHVCAVRGNFDDAQSAVKRIFADAEFGKRLQDDDHVALSSANSINVGRLVPQVVYYFAAYMQLVERGSVRHLGDPVQFVVPTGNFGDILAGYYAKRLGLPVSRLIVASDRNNVLYDFLTTGTYNRERPFFQTTSPSMDILVSSNLERMLYYLSGGDCELIANLMHDLDTKGSFTVPAPLLTAIQNLFGCGWADETQVSDAIRECWQTNHYLIDPHTACGYHVLRQMPRDDGDAPRVLLSTASPYKFPRVVGKAIGLDCPANDFRCMDTLAAATGTTAPAALRNLETKPERFTDTIDITDMPEYVANAAQLLAAHQ